MYMAALFAQQDNGAGALAGAALSLMVVVWILGLLATVFWLWMLIDVLTSNRPTNEKILWFLVVFFLHLIGAVAYFLIARRRPGSAAVGGG
jgi:hypothetical protein